MWKFGVPLLLVAASLSLALALDRQRPRADVVVINRGDVATLDPHRMSWMQDLRLAAALWEGLVRPDPLSAGFEAQPGVAERWEVSPDGRTYTFHLRVDARWSNGEPVTAEDFRRSWLRGCLPDTGGDYLNLFGLIDGVRDLVTWREAALADLARSGLEGPARDAAARGIAQETRRRFDERVGVRAPDSRTLAITLERPTPFFLDVLGYEVMAPVWMPGIEPFERLDPRTGRIVTDPGWTRPGRLVCNGPMVLAEWRFKREIRLERNEHYWNRAGVAIESISIPTVDDPTAQIIAARTGAADWLTDAAGDARRELVAAMREAERAHGLAGPSANDPAARARYADDPRLHTHVFPSFGTFFLNLNCAPALPDGRPNPLADARVRRALALAVDKRAIADLRGIGEPVAGSLTPPGSIDGYTPPAGLGRDPEEARRILASAGYGPMAGRGAGLPAIEILFNKDAGHDVICQSIASDWRRELGLEVVLRQKERRAFRDDLKNNNFMVSTANWFGDYGDPTTFLDINRTADGNNDRRFSDPEYDALLDAARDRREPGERLATLARAERMIVEDRLPLIPLLHECTVTIFDPRRLGGVSDHPRQKQQMGLLRRLDR